MIVIYYQLFIAASIIVAYFATDRLRNLLRRERLTPMGGALLVGVAWSLFTLTHVFAPPLMAVQFTTIWGVVGVLWLLRRKDRELQALRRALHDSEPQTVDRILGLARAKKLRPIAGRAHRQELTRAFDEAEKSIVILSGWANDRVVDRDFMRRLRRALNRGVNVYVGFGWTSPIDPAQPSPSELRAKGVLEGLADEATQPGAGKLYLAKWPNHAKLLVCDDRWAICGSHNWLSNRGFSNEERSWAIDDPEFVRAERDVLIRRIRLGSEARVVAG